MKPLNGICAIVKHITTSIIRFAKRTFRFNIELRTDRFGESIESSNAMKRLVDITHEMNQQPQSLKFREIFGPRRRGFQNLEASRNSMHNIGRRIKSSDLLIGSCAERKVHKMPHSTLRKLAIKRHRLLIAMKRALIVGCDQHSVCPGSYRNQIFISPRCE